MVILILSIIYIGTVLLLRRAAQRQAETDMEQVRVLVQQVETLNKLVEELSQKNLLPDGVEDLAIAARPLIESVQARDPANSGENKRHQVYARMLKQYPGAPHWKIGLAIEWAVAHFGGK